MSRTFTNCDIFETGVKGMKWGISGGQKKSDISFAFKVGRQNGTIPSAELKGRQKEQFVTPVRNKVVFRSGKTKRVGVSLKSGNRLGR